MTSKRTSYCLYKVALHCLAGFKEAIGKVNSALRRDLLAEVQSKTYTLFLV